MSGTSTVSCLKTVGSKSMKEWLPTYLNKEVHEEIGAPCKRQDEMSHPSSLDDILTLF